MTYEMYRSIFLWAAVACGVLFVVTLTLFFVLRIPKIVSDLSGRTARKGIENIRMQNEQTGDKTYRSSPVNLQRGKLTDKISPSGRLVPRADTPFGTGTITQKISTQKIPQNGGNETTVLPDGNETTVRADETTVLNEQPTPPNAYYGETSVLNMPVQTAQIFEVEYEITFIHTAEVIE